jgi:hypothetical protein
MVDKKTVERKQAPTGTCPLCVGTSSKTSLAFFPYALREIGSNPPSFSMPRLIPLRREEGVQQNERRKLAYADL